jgi:CRP/FNR family transcriptional regulator, dissimilatory nitrate respiration regulator
MREEFFDIVKALATAKHQFSRDAKLFKAGERVIHLHIIRTGEAHLLKNDSDIIIKRYTPHNIIAEASLFSDQYHCTCVAATRLETYSLSKTTLLDHIRTDQRLALLWMEYLSQQLMQARKMIAILGMKTVHERMSAFTALTQDQSQQNLTNIARTIGVSREALYREVAKNKKQKLGAL